MLSVQSAPNLMPTVPYSSIDDLLEQINNTPGDALMIQHVSPQDFFHISSERERQGRKFRLSLYSADTQVLIITIPTRPHEMLHAYLDDDIFIAVIEMGLRDFKRVGSTTYSEMDADGQMMSRGEGDSCRVPSSREHAGDFPTLVIEAGYTQSWPSLIDKANWWFKASRYDVKIVLLVKMNQRAGRIDIEKWKGVPVPQPGATTRSRTQPKALQPTRVDSIRITRVPGTNPAVYNVTGPLQLEFVDLFLRQPLDGEHDVVLDIADLQRYANGVWTGV
ncbi:hypothetical protein AX14_003915 [Amanita brunnescens Koide BX004]|nr:hypothetical protein AX14_003915 [Amanita brunnescens Koide BX004]